MRFAGLGWMANTHPKPNCDVEVVWFGKGDPLNVCSSMLVLRLNRDVQAGDELTAAYHTHGANAIIFAVPAPAPTPPAAAAAAQSAAEPGAHLSIAHLLMPLPLGPCSRFP